MNMRVWVDGKDFLLNDKNWITAGGEADIYKVQNKAFKILKNPKDRNLQERVLFAQQWKSLNIAKPEALIKSQSGDVLGLVMPWINGDPLLMAFNNNWRQTHNVTSDTDALWTEQIRVLVDRVLASGARMVDANEWNYLISKNNIWAIDADSWCIPGMHATAQMPSIKDWHTPVESPESDWFAAAVVSFQLWTGIHPYKGNIDGFKKGDMPERMRQNVSVLHNGVKVPSVTRDWNAIPKGLLNWYLDVFEQGGRDPMPPSSTWNAIKVVTVANMLKQVVSGVLNKIPLVDGLLKGQALVVTGNYVDLSLRPIAWHNKQSDFMWETYPSVFTSIAKTNDVLTLTTEFSETVFDKVDTYWINDNFLWVLYDDSLCAYSREDLMNKSYFRQAARWPRTSNMSLHGNVSWAFELGGVCAWYVKDNGPMVSRLKFLDGHKILRIVQAGQYLLVASKASKKGATELSLFDTVTEKKVFTQDIPENTFNAVQVGKNGLLIVVEDGQIWLWNGSSMSKTDGDVLLSDNLLSYEGKPFIERKSKIFRLSNKT